MVHEFCSLQESLNDATVFNSMFELLNTKPDFIVLSYDRDVINLCFGIKCFWHLSFIRVGNSFITLIKNKTSNNVDNLASGVLFLPAHTDRGPTLHPRRSPVRRSPVRGAAGNGASLCARVPASSRSVCRPHEPLRAVSLPDQWEIFQKLKRY